MDGSRRFIIRNPTAGYRKLSPPSMASCVLRGMAGLRLTGCSGLKGADHDIVAAAAADAILFEMHQTTAEKR
jgi:hypothetical protein